jgi:hypothetical protein
VKLRKILKKKRKEKEAYSKEENQPLKQTANLEPKQTIAQKKQEISYPESKKKKSIANKGNIPWNKGNGKPLKISTCLYCGNDIEHRKTNKKYHKECWIKASGGYRKGAGIGKSGRYKGIWCDSSYELVLLFVF